MGTPWIVSGQTLIQQGVYKVNPTPNNLGVLGEIHALPYTVPVGKQLRLYKWGIEAYPPATAQIGMNCWVGTGTMGPPNALPSVNAGAGVGNEFVSAQGWVLPAGTIFNVNLYLNGPVSQCYESWWVEGVLEDVAP